MESSIWSNRYQNSWFTFNTTESRYKLMKTISLNNYAFYTIFCTKHLFNLKRY